MKNKIKKICLLLCLAVCSIVMAVCSSASPRAPESEESLTGVYVSGDHYKLQWILYFTQGITVAYGQGNVGQQKVIPWRGVEFLKLEPGKYDFDLYFQYGGKAGKVAVCVTLNEGDLLHFKYEAPFILLNDGDLDVIDVRTGSSLPYKDYCPDEE